MSVAAKISERLRQAEQAAVPIPPVRGDVAADDIAAAYAIQDCGTEAGLRAGRRLVGRKIGLTAKSVQRQLGVDQPDYGMLFADMELADGDEVPSGLLIAPRVEAEMAFLLGRDLDCPSPTMADVLRSVEAVMPAIEVVDSRIAGWDIRLVDTVADNASSGRFVLGGTARSIAGVDLRLAGMVMERQGEPVATGAGAACLGHPLIAVQWLARKMVEVGRPLVAGDLVMSGALGPVVPAGGGDWFEARINGLGSVRIAFARSA